MNYIKIRFTYVLDLHILFTDITNPILYLSYYSDTVSPSFREGFVKVFVFCVSSFVHLN